MLIPILREFQQANTWKDRQSAYSRIVEFMLDQHNQLHVTSVVHVQSKRFHTRPFYVADGETITTRLRQQITDPDIKKLFTLPTAIGSIDQISDETTLRDFPAWREKLKQLYSPS